MGKLFVKCGDTLVNMDYVYMVRRGKLGDRVYVTYSADGRNDITFDLACDDGEGHTRLEVCLCEINAAWRIN